MHDPATLLLVNECLTVAENETLEMHQRLSALSNASDVMNELSKSANVNRSNQYQELETRLERLLEKLMSEQQPAPTTHTFSDGR